MAFDVDPRDADHNDLKFASHGASTNIASGLRLHKQLIVSTEDGAT